MLVTDMDDTLYPLSIGLNLFCRKNIQGTYSTAITKSYIV